MMDKETSPLKRIAPDVTLGKDVKIYDFVNLYGCEIDDNSKIGTFVEIQKGSKIGKNCKISSHTFICEGVTVEDDVFVGHGPHSLRGIEIFQGKPIFYSLGDFMFHSVSGYESNDRSVEVHLDASPNDLIRGVIDDNAEHEEESKSGQHVQ